MNELYTVLHDLYFSLNDDLLNDLERYTADILDKPYQAGNYNNLNELITNFCSHSNLDIDDLKELKNDNSIGCMTDYYELIDYMADIEI